MKRQDALDQLTRHEGLKLKPYRDTVGKLTIGVGRNLDDVGISIDEAMLMLDNDFDTAEQELQARFPLTRDLDGPRYYALVNMCFNLGVSRLAMFKKMWSAIADGDWDRAADEALDSKWARQVGNRATELAQMLRNG